MQHGRKEWFLRVKPRLCSAAWGARRGPHCSVTICGLISGLNKLFVSPLRPAASLRAFAKSSRRVGRGFSPLFVSRD